MELKGRALFNLLRINWLEDRSLQVKAWQVEDYRALTDEEIYRRLAALGIALDAKQLRTYAESCETPEELVEHLWLKEEDLEGEDQAYLLLFEIWRRSFAQKRTLSIFCDALDEVIEQFDQGERIQEEKVKEMLTELEDILDQAVDEGGDPQEVFAEVRSFCAHDLESFLYDVIVAEIEGGNSLYASELLDGFSAYISFANRFAFLRARLFATTDCDKANLVISRLLEQLQEEKDTPFLFEIARYLAQRGDAQVYSQAVRQLEQEIVTEAERQLLKDLQRGKI
jgi:hypothetical protein